MTEEAPHKARRPRAEEAKEAAALKVGWLGRLHIEPRLKVGGKVSPYFSRSSAFVSCPKDGRARVQNSKTLNVCKLQI